MKNPITAQNRLPVLFTSHGNPLDIIKSSEERPFWQALYDTGVAIRSTNAIRSILIISAHWCTRGTSVTSSATQTQIFDYYGFSDEYYEVKYAAKGDPPTAHQIHTLLPNVTETEEWGLDHGAWPMLMHFLPEADVPVLQLSINYYAQPRYHFDMGRKLQSLRNDGVLIIGSGALIHNLEIIRQKMIRNTLTPDGWELEYDRWIKEQLDSRNIDAFLNYETSHPLGRRAAPTPDHFVPVLYVLGLMKDDDELHYFFEEPPTLAAFGERSFVLS